MIYDEHGNFITYKINLGECYIEDLYVIPEMRKSKVASSMADQIYKIAKDNDCTILTGSVDLKSLDPTLGIQAVTGYGMKYIARKDDFLIFGKEI